MKILMVCHGNICRSPMAEFIMKDLVAKRGLEGEVYVESAAVSTEEIGNHIYPPAQRCLRSHGVWFDPRKVARQVKESDYQRFDMVVCMDRSNLRRIERFIPNGDPERKVRLMMGTRDVADPWYTGDFEATWDDCLAGCEMILREVYGE